MSAPEVVVTGTTSGVDLDHAGRAGAVGDRGHDDNPLTEPSATARADELAAPLREVSAEMAGDS